MIMIYNPTDEILEMQFEGRTYSMIPEEKLRVSEPCGKHLLTGYGARGLTSLEFGDEANFEKIKADAVKRNKEFKLKQVVEYNHRNESRKQMNMPFLIPPQFIKDYAKALGIELLAPFSVREEENARIQALTDQNQQLAKSLDKRDSEMTEMRAMMDKLMKNLQGPPEQLPSDASLKAKEAKGGKVS